MNTILKGVLIIALFLIAGTSLVRLDACQVQVTVVRTDANIAIASKEYIVKMIEGAASILKFHVALAIFSIIVVLFLPRKKSTVQGFSSKLSSENQ
jgi:hypothetical protein